MPSVFQRIRRWGQATAAEYRYQRALSQKAQFLEGLIERQNQEMTRINDREFPDDQKAVMRLAARERLYSGDHEERMQTVTNNLNEAIGVVAHVTNYNDGTPPPKGRGVGGFFGRLFNGRFTAAQRERQARTNETYATGRFLLNRTEAAALETYRETVSADQPWEAEAKAVASALAGKRPRRYHGISPTTLQLENEPMTPDDRKDGMGAVYVNGTNMLGKDATEQEVLDGTVKLSRIVEGPPESKNPEQDATFRLGWQSLAIFRKKDGSFVGVKADGISPENELDANGKVRIGEVTPVDIEGRKFGQISTASVTGCTVVIIKKGDTYAMLHLDAKHTMDGEAKNFLLDQINATFGNTPGDIEIMESIRSTSPDQTPSGEAAPPSEVTFCDDLERMLRESGHALHVQRLDRSRGQTAENRHGANPLSMDDPSGHLEIGLTSQDVVYGDRIDVEENTGGHIQAAPVEWRLGASQATVDAIWERSVRHHNEFTAMGEVQSRADALAESRVRNMERVDAGGIHLPQDDPRYQGRHSELTALALATAATVEYLPTERQQMEVLDAARVQMNDIRERARGQARAPQAEARQTQAPQAETREAAAPQAQAREAAAPQAETRRTQAREAGPQRERIDHNDLRRETGSRSPEQHGARRRAETPPSPEREAPQREARSARR
jgi:hypothetical protein